MKLETWNCPAGVVNRTDRPILPSRTDPMSAPRLALERMMHRQSIAVPGESLATYALLKLVPAADGPAGIPLTLALCIDISGSMYWGYTHSRSVRA